MSTALAVERVRWAWRVYRPDPDRDHDVALVIVDIDDPRFYRCMRCQSSACRHAWAVSGHERRERHAV